MNETNIPTLFRLAKNISKFSIHRYPMGALIVVKGHPVSAGYNQLKSNPSAWVSGLHAEIHAIKSCDTKNLRGASIFVYREDKHGNLAMARPCKNCLEVLKSEGFKYMYYTTKDFPFWNIERI